MISLVDRSNRAAFLSVCDRDVAMGPEIATLHAVYGEHSRMADFWLASSGALPTAAIARENGQIKLVMTPPADRAEILRFLDAVGEFDQVWADRDACARLYPDLPLQSGPVMRYTGVYPPGSPAPVVEALPLDDLYGLLSLCFEEFGPNGRARWCSFASHLVRHGLGTVAGIYGDQGLASTGGVYAQNSRYGVIACVATRPGERGKGHASQLVLHLCRGILRGGKTPALLCAGDALAGYYARLGFAPFGRWGKVLIAPAAIHTHRPVWGR